MDANSLPLIDRPSPLTQAVAVFAAMRERALKEDDYIFVRWLTGAIAELRHIERTRRRKSR